MGGFKGNRTTKLAQALYDRGYTIESWSRVNGLSRGEYVQLRNAACSWFPPMRLSQRMRNRLQKDGLWQTLPVHLTSQDVWGKRRRFKQEVAG